MLQSAQRNLNKMNRRKRLSVVFNTRHPVVFLILKIKLFYFEYQCFVKILQNQNTAHNKREKNVTQGEEKWAADRLIADCYPTFPLVQQC